jgi:hypothetical protein
MMLLTTTTTILLQHLLLHNKAIKKSNHPFFSIQGKKRYPSLQKKF